MYRKCQQIREGLSCSGVGYWKYQFDKTMLEVWKEGFSDDKRENMLRKLIGTHGGDLIHHCLVAAMLLTYFNSNPRSKREPLRTPVHNAPYQTYTNSSSSVYHQEDCFQSLLEDQT